jgi:hypothetical protein
MELAQGLACGKLLLDLLFYEKSCRRLSPEMKCLLNRRLEKCSGCRRRVLSFQRALMESEIVRNFG